MNEMEILTMSETLISKIMKECGIENTTVIFRGNDYIVSILKVEKTGFHIEIKELEKSIKKDDKIQLVMTIDGKRYFLTLNVSTLNMGNGRLIIETTIVGKVNLEVRDTLNEILEGLRFINIRKFERILLDEETLQNFNIAQKMKIMYPHKEYSAFIRNISTGGINFLTTENFLNESDEMCTVSVNFTNPAENMSIVGNVVRKNGIVIAGEDFAEVAMALKESIYLSKRIYEYFKKIKTAKIAY